MLNRALSGGGSFDQYCFQIKLVRLTSQTPQDFTFKVSVSKGVSLMEETRDAFTMQGKNIELNGVPVNFSLPNYNPKRPIDFTVQLTDIDKGEVIGSFPISSSEFIEEYKQHQTLYFERTAELEGDLSLKYVLFLEKSRIALINQIKQVESEKNFFSTQQIPPSAATEERITSPTRKTLSRKNNTTPVKDEPSKAGNRTGRGEDQKSVTSETPSRSGRIPIKRTRDRDADEKASRDPTPVQNRDSLRNSAAKDSKTNSVIVEPTDTVPVVAQKTLSSEVRSQRVSSVTGSAVKQPKEPKEAPKLVQERKSEVKPPAAEKSVPASASKKAATSAPPEPSPKKKEVKAPVEAANEGGLAQNKNVKFAIIAAVLVLIIGFIVPKMFGRSKVPHHHKKKASKKL